MRVQRYNNYFFLPNFSNKKTKKKVFSFGFPLAYSYLWLRRRYFRSGKSKKNKFSFGFPLAYSYLCTDSNGIKSEN